MMKTISVAIAVLIIPFVSYARQSDLLSMDLEDLSQVAVTENIATLTLADPKELPASVVNITYKEIAQSGARSLDELLEIYVPGFAYMYKVEGNQMGIRGIVSDRNNKIMLLVNGKKMNTMTSDGGAVTERWFPLLGDIRRITVVNGPGSAVYGAGAIAGVINIETFDGSESEGLEVSLQGGIGEEFVALQMRYSYAFENGDTLFAYFGVDDYRGASDQNAPHKLSFDTVNRPWMPTGSIGIHANEPIPFHTTRDNATFQDMLRYKAHVQYQGEYVTLWSRYTKSGSAIPTLQGYYRSTAPLKLQDTGTVNQQWTTVGRYMRALNERWRFEATLGYMVSDTLIDVAQDGAVNKNWRERELSMKVVTHYISEDMLESLAVGMEYDYMHFGERSGIGNEPYSHIGGLPDGTKWHSDMFSVFGEYQTHIANDWTVFAGFRADKHTYSDWMFSPRLSAIYMPDTATVWKVVYNRSVRHSDDADLYKLYLNEGINGVVETIDNMELMFDYTPDKRWHIALSAYFNRHHVVSYNDALKKTGRIGKVDFFGLEATAIYRYDNMVFTMSHNYTKQADFTLYEEDTLRQNISASVKGYGNDLANWYNHMTKMNLHYEVSPKFSWDSSLRIFWNMPGAVDMAEYNMDTFSSEKARVYYRLPLYTDTKEAFSSAVYWNLSAHYRYDESTEISLYGYNLVGLFDGTYNKRNYFQRTSHYREASPSLSLKIDYRFD